MHARNEPTKLTRIECSRYLVENIGCSFSLARPEQCGRMRKRKRQFRIVAFGFFCHTACDVLTFNWCGDSRQNLGYAAQGLKFIVHSLHPPMHPVQDAPAGQRGNWLFDRIAALPSWGKTNQVTARNLPGSAWASNCTPACSRIQASMRSWWMRSRSSGRTV